jgi:hypothetical protein
LGIPSREDTNKKLKVAILKLSGLFKVIVSPISTISGRSPQENMIFSDWHQPPKIEHILPNVNPREK